MSTGYTGYMEIFRSLPYDFRYIVCHCLQVSSRGIHVGARVVVAHRKGQANAKSKAKGKGKGKAKGKVQTDETKGKRSGRNGRVVELRHPSWQTAQAEQRKGKGKGKGTGKSKGEELPHEPRWRIRVEYDSDSNDGSSGESLSSSSSSHGGKPR